MESSHFKQIAPNNNPGLNFKRKNKKNKEKRKKKS